MRFTLGTGSLHSPRRTPSRSTRVALVVALTLALLPAMPIAQAAPGDPVRYEQTDDHISWSGVWTRVAAPGASGGDHTFTNATNATARFAFTGTGFDLIGMRGPKCGIVAVSVDGAPPVNVDCYAADSAFDQTLLSLAGMTPGLHTVTVTVTGTQRAEAADAFVGIDAVVVLGDLRSYPVDQGDTHIVRRGAWTTMTSPSLFGGTQHLTNTAGNELAVAFNGTSLDLVGMMGPKFGIASVSVDGGTPVDVDLYSPDSRFRQIIFSTGALAAGAHTVRVVCSGRTNVAATDSFISLDAVLPAGTLTQATIRYEDTDPHIAGNGELHEAYAGVHSGGRYLWAGPKWGAVAVSFVGARFDWIGVTGPQYGIASVRIDGGAPQHVDLYAPGINNQQLVFTTGEIGYGAHTVTISWTGRANGAATGTYLSFDAFDIGGDIAQATPPARPAEAISFGYPWARYIVVDKSDFRLYFIEDGVVVKSYPVAHARVGATTPNAIWRIDAKYYSDPLSVYGPRKMRLFRQQGNSYVYSSFLIHGTNNPASIGTRASAGCIRMYNEDVLEFYPLVPLGTMVVTRD